MVFVFWSLSHFARARVSFVRAERMKGEDAEEIGNPPEEKEKPPEEK